MRKSKETQFREQHSYLKVEYDKLRNELRESHFDLKGSTEALKKMCQRCDRQGYEIQRLRSLLLAVKVLTRAAGE